MAGQGSRWAEPAVAAVPHLPVPSPVLSALAFPAWEAQAGLVAPLRRAVHVQHGLRELLDLFCFSSDTPLPSRCWCLPSAEPNPSPAAAKSQITDPELLPSLASVLGSRFKEFNSQEGSPAATPGVLGGHKTRATPKHPEILPTPPNPAFLLPGGFLGSCFFLDTGSELKYRVMSRKLPEH